MRVMSTAKPQGGMGMSNMPSASYVLMIIVKNRGKGEKWGAALAEEGITFTLFSFARGTADSKILSYLGLGETEKDVLYCAMPQEKSEEILERLHTEEQLNAPGRGIAFTIPINGYGDAASQKSVAGMVEIQGGKIMERPHLYDVIIAVTNSGHADDVMDAAKSAGAFGGTVLPAKSAGFKQAEKFFGVAIKPAKEMLFMLTRTELCQNIMHEISAQAGLHTAAGTIVFSLPVNGVAGLPAQENQTG